MKQKTKHTKKQKTQKNSELVCNREETDVSIHRRGGLSEPLVSNDRKEHWGTITIVRVYSIIEAVR